MDVIQIFLLICHYSLITPLYTLQVVDLEGASRLQPPTPTLGDGLTPSLTVMLANAKY